MRRKAIAIFLVSLSFFRVNLPVVACCEGSPPGNPDCYKCEDGVWVLEDWAECGQYSDCKGECHGGCYLCTCADDDSKCASDECCDGTCCEEGKICCPDGSCALPCEQKELHNCMASAINSICTECYMLPWYCDDTTRAIVSGNHSIDCWNGCPGDCHPVDKIHCYTIYKCANDVDYLALCEWITVGPEEEWEWKCVGNLLGLTCYECVQDPTDEGEKIYASSEECN